MDGANGGPGGEAGEAGENAGQRPEVGLTVVWGPLDGKRFTFRERATCILGRSPSCYPQLPDDDRHSTVSRFHCLLDINPPLVRVRDFGSLNGTRLNGRLIGRRAQGMSAREGAGQPSPEHDLQDGDEVRIGDTVLRVSVTRPGTVVLPPPDDAPSLARTAVDGLIDVARLAPADAPVARLAGYEILREVGRGGMGAVFLARRHGTDDVVALKVMLPRAAADAGASARFLREIDVSRRLRHPRIVTVHDHGEAGGVFYFTSEYCPGGSLDQLIARHGGTLAPSLAVRIALQALEGLDHAHVNGVVHRDLTLSNILLGAGPDLHVRLADFGLAKAFDLAGLSGLTRTGAVAGKPVFMPRAQVVNFRDARPEVDVWALAACLYQMLTGVCPRDFPDGRDPGLVVLTDPAVPVRQRVPTLPPKLAQVIDHALREEPQIGFSGAAEFADALRGSL